MNTLPTNPSQFIETIKEEVEFLLGSPSFRRPVVQSVLEQVVGLQHDALRGNLAATPELVEDLKARIDKEKIEQFKDELAKQIEARLSSPSMKEDLDYRISELLRQTVTSLIYAELEGNKERIVRQIKKTAKDITNRQLSAWQNPEKEAQ